MKFFTKISSIIVSEDTFIKKVILTINKTGSGIALVADKEKKILGTITDGDVRRAILNNTNLFDKASAIMNQNPFVLYLDELLSINIENVFNKKQIRYIPIVDKQKKIIDLVIKDSFVKPFVAVDNFFVIMAGGEGRRLRPYTEFIPKAMIDINGKPMILYIIEKAISEGFKNFIISVNYLSEKIKSYLKDGNSLGIKIHYIEEKKPLGTAGSLFYLKKINKKTANLPIFVTNCDLITNVKYIDILKYHNEENADVTLCVREHLYQNPFGVVKFKKNQFITFDEKPTTKTFINAGLYVLDFKLISNLKSPRKIDMTNFIEDIKYSGNNVLVFPIHEKWFDVGKPKDYEYLSSLAKNLM